MKPVLFFCCLIQCWSITIFAQKDESRHKWTTSIVYSPRFEKHERTRNFHAHYPISPGLLIEYKINEQLSVSLGTSYNYEKLKLEPLVFKEPPKIIYGFSTNTLYGIPVQLKYFYTKDKSKKILPFVKTAVIGTYNKLYSETLYLSKELEVYIHDEFYVYLQLGYGIDAKLYKALSISAQIAYGRDLRNKSSEKSHIEPLLGLRYNF